MDQITEYPIVKFEVQLRDPRYWIDGVEYSMFEILDWSEVPYKHVNAGEICEHCETVCIVCAESWAIDHWIRLTDSTGQVFDLKQIQLRIPPQS